MKNKVKGVTHSDESSAFLQISADSFDFPAPDLPLQFTFTAQSFVCSFSLSKQNESEWSETGVKFIR